MFVVFFSYNSQVSRRKSVGVDMVFLQRMKKLLPIIVPGVFTPEFGYLVVVAGAMIGRTLCDLWVLSNGTAIENAIISRDFNVFFWFLC